MTFLDAAPAQRAFRAMFLRGRDLTAPVAPLADIPHWASPLRDLLPAGEGYLEKRAWIPGGYFYGISTPADREGVAAAAADGRAAGADCVLLPVVADPTAPASAGYVCIPWFFDAIYELRAGLQADLFAVVGRKRGLASELLTSRYRAAYQVTFVRGPELRERPDLVDTFDRLHQLNLEKCGHGFNFYNRRVLDVLLRSELGDAVVMYFSHHRHTGAAAHAELGLLSAATGEYVRLVMGIDGQQRSPDQNLYISAARTLFEWGLEHGVRRFWLGRGNELQKIGFGANRVRALYNCVLPLDADLAGLAPIAAAVTRRSSETLATLATVGRGQVHTPTMYDHASESAASP